MNPLNQMTITGRSYHFTLILIVLFTVLSPGKLCAQIDEKKATLVGTWLFDEQHSFTKIDSDAKKQMDTIPTLRIQLESIYRGRKVVFGQDGSFSILLVDGRSATGNWTLTNDDILLMEDSQGNTMARPLGQLSKTKMVLLNPYTEGGEKPLMSEIHYTKLY